MGFNYNVGRGVGVANSDMGGRVRRAASQGQLPTLQKAVVLDVIYDPNILSEEYKTRLKMTVNNFELVEVLPVNAVIARIVSASSGLTGNQDTILFPLLSSHIMLPVQVGEIVTVIYEDQYNLGTKIGYWISRTHGDRATEDVNYTHLDRRFDPLNNMGNWSTEDLSSVRTSPIPGFPNGAGTPDTGTLIPQSPNSNPYDEIIQRSLASKLFTMEPVPRWKKRPSEFVFQGANNTLIVLGEDRKSAVSGSLAQDNPDFRGQAGSMIFVAGRGRFMGPGGSQDNPPGSGDPIGTAPRVIQNSRGEYETDKAPWRNQDPNGQRGQDNTQEGDLDFKNDAAISYISMRTKGDENFGIVDLPFGDSTLLIEQLENENSNNESTTSANHSYVIHKADHIRAIARKDKEKGIEGTVLFVREGDDDDQDLSFVFINKHGVNIDSGKKIYLGRSAHENPEENSNINFNDNDGPYEPYILWSKYRDTVDSLQKQINELKDQHEKSIKELRNGVKVMLDNAQKLFLANNVAIPYSPNPGVTAAAQFIASNIPTIGNPVDQPLKQANNNINNEQNSNNDNNVSKINHSQKIYGE